MRWLIAIVVESAIVTTALIGCASEQKPPFQKLDGHESGYQIEDSPHKWIFKVKTTLPSKVDDKFAVFYGYRAIGEECLARGFAYFDAGVSAPTQMDGYCYATMDHPGLGIEFTEVGLLSRPQRFFISSLNEKTNTRLKKNDEIAEIDGIPVVSLAQIKTAVAKVVLAGGHNLQMKVNRDEKSIILKEPIAVFKNSSMGSDVLELARSRVN